MEQEREVKGYSDKIENLQRSQDSRYMPPPAKISEGNLGGQATPYISLREATEKEPISFWPTKRTKEEKEKPKRKEVNLGDLKKVLEESLKKKVERPEKKVNNIKKGVMKPGETVKF